MYINNLDVLRELVSGMSRWSVCDRVSSLSSRAFDPRVRFEHNKVGQHGREGSGTGGSGELTGHPSLHYTIGVKRTEPLLIQNEWISKKGRNGTLSLIHI